MSWPSRGPILSACRPAPALQMTGSSPAPSAPLPSTFGYAKNARHPIPLRSEYFFGHRVYPANEVLLCTPPIDFKGLPATLPTCSGELRHWHFGDNDPDTNTNTTYLAADNSSLGNVLYTINRDDTYMLIRNERFTRLELPPGSFLQRKRRREKKSHGIFSAKLKACRSVHAQYLQFVLQY